MTAVLLAGAPVPPRLRGRRAVLLIPGEQAVRLDYDTPARLPARAADRLARSALSDLAAAPVEDQHIVRLPPGDDPGTGRAIVIGVDAMRAALDGASTARVNLVLPDYLALPAVADGWAIAVEGGRARVRLGPLDGFSAEEALATALLTRERADAPPALVRLYGAPSQEIRDAVAGLATEHGDTPPDPTFRGGEAAANLRTGPFGDNPGMRRALQRWRLPTALAAAALALWAIDGRLTQAQVAERAAMLDDRIEALFRQDFEPAGPIVDIRIQAMRRLEALQRGADSGAAGGFLALLGTGAEILATGARSIERLSYRDGALLAEISVPDFQALGTLQAALGAAGLDVDVAFSGASAGEGVTAGLSITAGAGDG